MTASVCRRDMREFSFGVRCPDCGHVGTLHPPMARGSVCEACQQHVSIREYLAAMAPQPVVWQMRVAEGPGPLRSQYQR